MPEVKQFAYTHKEVIGLMLKDQNIHEGHWAIHVEFGFGAGNFPASPRPKPDEPPKDMFPGALMVVTKLGIIRHNEPNPVTVDASVVNPSTASSTNEKVGSRRRIVSSA